MKVAILTMFNGLSNTYSLVNVVKEQLKMLLEDGNEVKVLVSEHCSDKERVGIFADERIEWVKIVNSKDGKIFHWKTYTKAEDEIESDFYEQVDMVALDFEKNLKDVNVCIMHDILYQGVHLLHNAAIRKAQEKLKNVKFLSFTHSVPTTHLEAKYPINCMFTPMPNTKFVYPTECGLKALAEQYNVDISQCACVSNSIDVTVGISQQARLIASKMDIYSKDILIVYPARLTMAKRFHIVAQFAGVLKRYCHMEVGVIFCDFPSMDIDAPTYRFMTRDIGKKNGLDDGDILFTSECGFIGGVSRETVFDLFSLSNLFICPSYSESFGLTVAEAASRGNFIVLNEAVPALEELGKNLSSYFMRWSARNFGHDTYEKYEPNELVYYIENAHNIVRTMGENSVIRAKTLMRTKYSNDFIYKTMLKPLLAQ